MPQDSLAASCPERYPAPTLGVVGRGPPFGKQSRGSEAEPQKNSSKKPLTEVDNIRRLEAKSVKRSEPVVVDVGFLDAALQHNLLLPIVNSTGKNLTISGVISSCGCAVGVPSSKIFESDATIEIGIVLKPKSLGPFSRKISFVFQDNGLEPLSLVINGSFRSRFSLEENALSVSPTNATIDTILISNFEGVSPKLVTPTRGVAANVETKVLTKSRLGLTIKVAPSQFEKGDRTLDEVLHVTATDGRISECPITFTNQTVVNIHPRVGIAKIVDDKYVAKFFLRGGEQHTIDSFNAPLLSVSAKQADDVELSASLIAKTTATNGLFSVELEFDKSIVNHESSIDLQWKFNEGEFVVNNKMIISSSIDTGVSKLN